MSGTRAGLSSCRMGTCWQQILLQCASHLRSSSGEHVVSSEQQCPEAAVCQLPEEHVLHLQCCANLQRALPGLGLHWLHREAVACIPVVQWVRREGFQATLGEQHHGAEDSTRTWPKALAGAEVDPDEFALTV